MYTSPSLFRKTVGALASLSLMLSSFAVLVVPIAHAAPNWDVSGSWVADFNFEGTDYSHDMALSQDIGGGLTGTGGHPAGGPHTYEWAITSGAVDGDTIEFDVDYTMGADALSPLTTMHVEGTIAPDGSMSGTWSDNYQGGERTGTWESTSGEAAAVAPEPAEDVTVTIAKYIDGVHATAGNANGQSFGMVSSWSDTGFADGTNVSYPLAPASYEAETSPMDAGANYSTHEVLDGTVVGESCMEVGGPQFELRGYTIGDSLEEAQQATPSMDEPSFSDLDSDKYVIVWNHDCSQPDTVTVTINKFIDGEQATAQSADSSTFPMQATYSFTNDQFPSGIAGSDPYDIGPVGNNTSNPYEAVSLNFDPGADYATYEITDGEVVGASCEEDGTPFALAGYTWGNTPEEAQAMEPSNEAPSFENLQNNKYVIVWNETCDDGENPEVVRVIIDKYVDGEPAEASTTQTTSFSMVSNWVDEGGIGTDSGSYTLSPAGYNSANAYEAITSDMLPGADYATSEVMDGTVVGESCLEEGGPAYRLLGYTTGISEAAAAAGVPSMTSPSFTDLQDDMYVIVWNEACDDEPAPGPEFVKVVVSKFIDGEMATSGNANSASFPMISTTTASNVNGGAESGPNAFTLDAANGYDATTTDMASGASYATREIVGGDTVGASCQEGKPFALSGYSSGNTLAAAASAATSSVAPSFTNLTQDKYVIVWNIDCTNPEPAPQGALQVTSIDAQKTNGSANDTYEDGWRYVFHITAPTNEPNLSMKFSDWLAGSDTIPVANNMRLSSSQASNPGPVTLTAADVYSSPAFIMVTDLDGVAAGRQVEVVVELKIPVGTPNAAYTTTYGVQTLP